MKRDCFECKHRYQDIDYFRCGYYSDKTKRRLIAKVGCRTRINIECPLDVEIKTRIKEYKIKHGSCDECDFVKTSPLNTFFYCKLYEQEIQDKVGAMIIEHEEFECLIKPEWCPDGKFNLKYSKIENN